MHATDALTGGRWVVRRGIKVWTGPRPADDPAYFEPLVSPRRRTSIDPVQVDAAVSWHPRPDINIRERREAIRVLHARGLSDSEIAARIGCADRTVLRNRKILGLPANFPECRPGQPEEVAA